MKNFLLTLLFLIFCAGILILGLRGFPDDPITKSIDNPKWLDEGPLELSPDRARFALTYSVVEDKSLFFSLPVARFATPDLGYVDGKYVSLFAPGISFLVIPGYLFGRYFDLAQVGSFATISLFAILNVILIRAIAAKIGASSLSATIASVTFIFASPAFTYAVTLYQHHISTFLILLVIYTLIRWKNIWSLFLIWFLLAASIPVDYPNIFLMFPIAVYSLGRFIILKREEGKLNINLKLAGFITFITAVLPILFFLWFNKVSYGNPLQLSGTVASVKAIDEQGLPTIPEQFKDLGSAERFINPELQQKTAVGFFKTRNLLNGFYTHFISPDRGVFWFTPIMLFGILGMIFLYKKNPNITGLLIAVIGSNIILYSLWGDPWGGWAFGSRYLIPTYAVMSIFIAFSLEKYRKNSIFLLLFFVVMAYSIGVNTLGAITSSRNPPQAEVLNLEKLSGRAEKYTFERNIDYLNSNRSKSFVWQTLLKQNINAAYYYWFIVGLIVMVGGGLLTYMRIVTKERLA